jgi:hypothetical protein
LALSEGRARIGTGEMGKGSYQIKGGMLRDKKKELSEF